MKAQLATALLALGFLASTAQASALRVTSYQRSDDDAVVELEADADLGDPWVRIEGRTAKVWFPNIHDVASYERLLESGWVTSIRLRPGAHDTAVLRVELNNKQPLTTSNVEITRTGSRAVVRLVFPAATAATLAADTAKPAAAAPEASAQAVGASAKPAAEAKTTAEAKPTAETKAAASGAANAAVATPAAATSATPAVAQTPALATLAAAKKAATGHLFAAKSAASKQFSDAGDPRTLASGAGLLVVIALALGMVYAWLRGAQKRAQGGTPAPKIEIVSTKRVGPRHQLVMVRALGEDHLLSLNGGRAEHIASAPSPLPASAAAADHRPAARPGVFPMFASNAFARLQRSAENDANASATPERESEAVAFGGELRKLVQRWKTDQPTAAEGQSGVHTDSEAVAGIARLRRRAAV